MSRSCIECVHNNPNDPSDLAYACLNCRWPMFAGEPTNFKPRTITNADRIRSMTDEELAEFICHNVSNGTVNCAFCAAAEFCRMGHNGWLDWLREEVTDGKQS